MVQDGKVYRPVATDATDPATQWLALYADYILRAAPLQPSLLNERRALRSRLIDILAPWMALATMLVHTAPPQAAGLPAWLRAALDREDEPEAASAPNLLVLHNDRAFEDLRLPSGWSQTGYKINASRIEGSTTGSSLHDLIHAAHLILTDSAEAALSCALRGKPTIVVGDGTVFDRLPVMQTLTIAPEAQWQPALSERIAALTH